jgi:hypothetical protein
VSTNDKGTKGILVKTQYYDGSKLTPPDNTGKRLYEKAKDGFMPYWSIGFVGLDVMPRKDGGLEYKKWKLFEYSQVAVPDNIEAMVVKEMPREELDAKADTIITYEVQKDAARPGFPVSNDNAKDIRVQSIAVDDELFSLLKDKSSDQIRDMLFSVKTQLKSIAERVKQDLPIQAMFTLFYAFVDELVYNSDGSEKFAKAVLKEFVELVSPFAVALTRDDQTEAVFNKMKLTEEQPPAAETTAPAESVPQDTSVKRAVLGLRKESKPALRIAIKRDDLQSLVAGAVKSEMAAQLNKLRGKVE